MPILLHRKREFTWTNILFGIPALHFFEIYMIVLQDRKTRYNFLINTNDHRVSSFCQQSEKPDGTQERELAPANTLLVLTEIDVEAAYKVTVEVTVVVVWKKLVHG